MGYWTDLRHYNKYIQLRLSNLTERSEVYKIIGAAKVLEDWDIYEISLQDNFMSYTCWYAFLINGRFIFLTSSYHLDEITKAIKDEIWEREEIRKDAERYLDQCSALCQLY
jgi:hypothetical protein